MNNVPNFTQKLKDELCRLDLSIAEATRLADSDHPQRLKKIVSGHQKCPHDLLENLAAIGVDTTYVLTGRRSNSLPSSDTVSIPLYDVSAAAGSGSVVCAEEVDSFWTLPVETARRLSIYGENIMGVRVKGDSMEPTLTDNGWVMVNTDDTDIERRGVFVVRCGNELRVKRIQMLMGGEIKLISDNRFYDPEIVKIKDSDDISVIGRVVYQMGEMR